MFQSVELETVLSSELIIARLAVLHYCQNLINLK